MAVIICESCGELIKRNIKTVESLSGVIRDYHRDCWKKIQSQRTNEAHRLSHYRAMSLDRDDPRKYVKRKKADERSVVIGSRRRT